ncbi:Uncharacterised protein [Bordetella pertussis]|nr:Uncharacterised protein [Bordetella pertussis]CFW33572.1 Uncharacterised protein [Bordetella pertussis]CPI42843.1 Uncharacterised protein [Bordetella pertussis]
MNQPLRRRHRLGALQRPLPPVRRRTAHARLGIVLPRPGVQDLPGHFQFRRFHGGHVGHLAQRERSRSHPIKAVIAGILAFHCAQRRPPQSG